MKTSNRRSRRKTKRISHRRSRSNLKHKKRLKNKRRRHFGLVDGPGFEGQTSYPNGYVNYFGSSEPFVNASDYWYPITNGRIQSPDMIYSYAR